MPHISSSSPWIVSQIGAREHYAIPRALHEAGDLSALVTDFWVPPSSILSKLPGGTRLRDRFHPDLSGARVFAPNLRMLGFETARRLRPAPAWDTIIARNELFQTRAIRHLSGFQVGTNYSSNEEPGLERSERDGAKQREAKSTDTRNEELPPTLFSYSYAARELFLFAKQRGWKTVLGQIDPGPEEERLVASEHQRYAHLKSSWKPAPAEYWDNWHEEAELADRIIVNSPWSRQCLLNEGIAEDKIEIMPLVYETHLKDSFQQRTKNEEQGALSLLFLGQINLRKGLGRLLDAMRLLKNEPITLTLAGPSELDPSAWADLPAVRWTGPVPRSEVSHLYNEADVFILPTISDGYAITQLEALSHGLPVIASPFCGPAVIQGENGWILDNLEPSSLVEALRRALLTNPPSNFSRQEFTLRELASALTHRTRSSSCDSAHSIL